MLWAPSQPTTYLDRTVSFLPSEDSSSAEIDSSLTDADGNPTLAFFQQEMEKFTPPGCGTIYDPVWLAQFRLHHRGVNKFREGRLFVAGDAAHIFIQRLGGGQVKNTNSIIIPDIIYLDRYMSSSSDI